MEILRTDYLTVYRDKSEVIVFGDGSDWIVRYSRTSNTREGWQKWFGKRELAEEFAEKLSKAEYTGRWPKII